MAKVSPSVLGILTNDGRTPRDLASTPVCKQVLTISVVIEPVISHVVSRSTSVETPTMMKISNTYLTAFYVPFRLAPQLVACLEKLVADSEHGNSSSEDSQHIISDLLSTLTSDVSKPQPAANPKK